LRFCEKLNIAISYKARCVKYLEYKLLKHNIDRLTLNIDI